MSGLRDARRWAKHALLRTCDSSGLFARQLKRRRGSVWIACYHGVVSEARPERREGYENTVSAREFEEQLTWLGSFCRFLDLHETLAWLENPTPGRPPVLVTFDDGYRNNLSLAAPILLRLGIPAAFFLSTGYIGTDRLLWPLEIDARLAQSAGCVFDGRPLPASRAGQAAMARNLRQRWKLLPDDQRLNEMALFREATVLDPSGVDSELNRFLTWDEARSLRGHGFNIGSHTVEHPILSRLSPEALLRELRGSKLQLEKELGVPADSLAFPNGGASDYTPEVIEATRQAGYQSAFAVGDRLQPSFTAGKPEARYSIQRLIVPGHLPPYIFRFLASGIRETWTA